MYAKVKQVYGKYEKLQTFKHSCSKFIRSKRLSFQIYSKVLPYCQNVSSTKDVQIFFKCFTIRETNRW